VKGEIIATDGPIDQKAFGIKPENVFDAELAKETIKRTDKLNDASIDMALRVKQAREFLAWSASHLKSSWLEWMGEANKANSDINLLRMSFGRESTTIIATAKDIKDFFNSPEYLKAHATMKESMAMLDKFAELKQSGVLDAFSDFILKVSCK